jgi:hypothetical protein
MVSDHTIVVDAGARTYHYVLAQAGPRIYDGTSKDSSPLTYLHVARHNRRRVDSFNYIESELANPIENPLIVLSFREGCEADECMSNAILVQRFQPVVTSQDRDTQYLVSNSGRVRIDQPYQFELAVQSEDVDYYLGEPAGPNSNHKRHKTWPNETSRSGSHLGY